MPKTASSLQSDNAAACADIMIIIIATIPAAVIDGGPATRQLLILAPYVYSP